MRVGSKGRLIAMLAMTALVSSKVLGQTVTIAELRAAPPEQAQAFQQALQEGTSGLVAFMKTFPRSPLIPAVIRALAEKIGVEKALQIALDAGVSTNTVLAVGAEISPELSTTAGQLTLASDNVNGALTGQY